MKYELTISIVTEKTGLDLEDEYVRLGFPEEQQEDRFGVRHTTVEVSRDFVKANRSLFADLSGAIQARGTFSVDLEKTSPDDWQDWGSAGFVLNYENMSEDRIAKWLE